MVLKLHNTLTKQTEVFTPLDEKNKIVSFYSCGPTVYDFAHIGNFRAFLNADVLRRTLELIGYNVHQVMNITDVGHMTDDAIADGGGEDKMEVAATRLAEAKKSGELPNGISVDPSDPMAIAEFSDRPQLPLEGQHALRNTIRPHRRPGICAHMCHHNLRALH